MKTKHLHFCPHCKEYSVASKKLSNGKTLRFCLNKGCGWRLEIPNYNSLLLALARQEVEEVYHG